MVEFLKYLFASEKTLIQSLRSFGLTFTGRLPFVKNFFVKHAIGNRGDLPEMAHLCHPERSEGSPGKTGCHLHVLLGFFHV